MGVDVQINTIHKSLVSFCKRLQKEDKIFYQKENIIQKLDRPEVAESQGRLQFKNL